MIPIVIPAYEPQPTFVDYLRLLCAETEAPVVVVDDGSGERYQAVFAAAAALPHVTVLTHPVNRGKGCALKTAFAWLRTKESAVKGCVTADSDGQHAVSDVLAVRAALEREPEALILGCRDFSSPLVPRKSWWGYFWMRLFYCLVAWKNCSDTQTGLRGIPFSAFGQLESLPGERFEFELEMLYALRDRTFRELPIATLYVQGNAHTHLRPVVDTLKCFHVVLRYAVRRLPLVKATVLC